MSAATGLEVFDRTLQATHVWLDEIMDELGPDRQHALHVLRAVLHALRDRLPAVIALVTPSTSTNCTPHNADTASRTRTGRPIDSPVMPPTLLRR